MSENAEAMQQVAASLTESLIVEAAQNGQEGALQMIEEAQREAPAAVADPPATEPNDTAPTAAPVVTVDLNPKLPDDLAAELAEADLDAEVEAEVAALQPQEDEWGNEIPVDEDAARELIKLRKRNEYLERRVVEANVGAWRKEAETYLPLSKHALDDIAAQATSRKSFMRLAKKEHDRLLPVVQGYLAEAKVIVDAERDVATSEARSQVAEAWGQPVSGPDSGTPNDVDYEKRVNAAREKARTGGGLAGLFAELIRGPKG